MKIGITPRGSRVCILPDSPKEITKGGIILPDAAKHPCQFGKVIAIGPKSDLKLGTTVMFDIYSMNSGIKFEKDDMTFIIAQDDDVLAVIE